MFIVGQMCLWVVSLVQWQWVDVVGVGVDML